MNNAAKRVAEGVAVARVQRINLVYTEYAFLRNDARLRWERDVVFHDSIEVKPTRVLNE